MSACRSRAVPRLWRARIGFTFGLSARAGAGGHGATLGHAPALRGGYSGQCAKPLRMATRDPTLDGERTCSVPSLKMWHFFGKITRRKREKKTEKTRAQRA